MSISSLFESPQSQLP